MLLRLKRTKIRFSEKTGKGRRVEPVGGSVDVSSLDHPASFASRFDRPPVFEKDRKKNLILALPNLSSTRHPPPAPDLITLLKPRNGTRPPTLRAIRRRRERRHVCFVLWLQALFAFKSNSFFYMQYNLLQQGWFDVEKVSHSRQDG